MKTRTLTIIMAVTVLAIFASLAVAWGPGSGQGTRHGSPCNVPPIPNLTAEQASKIQAIGQGYLKEITPFRQQILAKRLELRSLWLSPNPDQAKINALQKEILNLIGQIQEKSTSARLEIRQVLTSEQQARLLGYGLHMGCGKGRMGWLRRF